MIEIKLLLLSVCLKNNSMDNIFLNKHFIEKNPNFIIEFNEANKKLNKMKKDFLTLYFENKYFLENNYTLVIRIIKILLEVHTEIGFKDGNAYYSFDIETEINGYKNRYIPNLSSLLLGKKFRKNTMSVIDFYLEKINILKSNFKELKEYLEISKENLLNNKVLRDFNEICGSFNDVNKYIEKITNRKIPKINV